MLQGELMRQNQPPASTFDCKVKHNMFVVERWGKTSKEENYLLQLLLLRLTSKKKILAAVPPLPREEEVNTGLPSGHPHFHGGKPHGKRALLEVSSSRPLSPPSQFLGERGMRGVFRGCQWVASGYLDHQGRRKSSFKGGETGSMKGHDLLGFRNEPVVESAESWLPARRPPRLSPALDARRL